MRKRNRAAIRVNPIIVIGVIGLIAIPIIMLMIGQSPEAAARDFMNALTKHDVQRLTQMSYLPDADPPLEQQWKLAFERAPNYVFGWQMEGSDKLGPDQAVVKILVIELRGPQLHENPTVNMPMVRRDGEWKVDLRSLTREFFPALPR